MIRRRRRRGRVFVLSFALTLLALIGLTAFLILGRAPTVPLYHLPAQLPSYQAPWAKYVPSNVLQLSVINYTLVRQLNASAVPPTSLLDLIKPNISVTPDMVRAEETILFQKPNATVSLIFMTEPSFSQFAAPVAETYGQSLTNRTATYLTDVDVYGQRVTGWLALIPQDHAVAFANGDQFGRQALGYSLQTANGTLSNILQRTELRQSLYILNATDGLLSFGFQNFPGVVQAGTMTMTAVRDVGNSIQVTYVVKFSSPDTARAQVSYMRSAYLSAHSFAQYDEFLEAVQSQPFSGLAGAVRLVG